MSAALPPAHSPCFSTPPAVCAAPAAALAEGDSPANSLPLALNSADLLRGHKTVEIQHNGLTYRLQATRLGKLILTK